MAPINAARSGALACSYIKEYPGIEGRLFSGGVPEWLKGTDCKSVGLAYVGSNPTPSTSLRLLRKLRLGEQRDERNAGVAQW